MLLLTLFFFQTTKAQPPALPGYTMQTFGAADGLTSSEIVSLYQDVKDFIWMGTRNGISRYDGRKFQNFEYINNNHIGTVYSIAEDKEGILWISSETGLYYWDGKTFVHCSFNDEAAYLPFAAIHFTVDGDAWIGTVKGPAHMPSLQKNNNLPLKNYLLQNWETVARHDGSVTFIHSSKKGVVFGAYINVYLYQNKELKKIPNPFEPREYLRDVFIDDAGIVYWNNVLSGLHSWNGKEIIKPLNPYGHFFKIYVKEGEMYLYSNAGIIEVEPTKKTTMLVNLEALALRMPSCMLIDKEGAYWLGATEGLFRIKKNEFTIHWYRQLPYSDEIYSLLRRRNGELLLGGNRGRIFSMNDTMRSYRNGMQVVPGAEVFSMYEEEEQNLWFGTGYQGIALYKEGKLKNFTKKNGLPDNTHYAFYKSTKGELWSAGDMGLTRIEKVSKDSFKFRPFFYPVPTGIHKVYGITEAPNGTIWAVGQLGLFYLDKDSLRKYTLPELKEQKLFITAIKKDKQGGVWVSTRGHGILLCTFDSYDRLHLKDQWRVEDGLTTNTFLSIALDDKDNVWAGSYSGVTALQSSSSGKFNIKNFDVRDGFMSKNYQSLSMYADGDMMWACTSSGAVSFKPASLLKKTRKAQLYITSIDLLNTKKDAEEFLIKDENGTGEFFKFPNDINSFSIHFAALYYTNPEAVRYYYQLQNIDSQWTSTGSERTILFRQLPPGNYNLLIKASIGGSDWTNTASLSFEIKKPWWLLWWVIAIAVLVTAAGIYFFIRRREKKLKQREQQKIEFEKIKGIAFQYQLEVQQVINYFTTSMNKHQTVDDMLWDMAENCISKLAFEDCVIYLIDEERNILQQKAAWGPKTTEENKIVNPIEIPLGKGIVGTVALTGKAEKIDDTTKDKRYIIDDAARASEITVPIYDGEKVIGVIDSEHDEPNFYTERHLQILTTIASHCGERISTIKAEATTATARMESLLNKQKALEASLQSMRLQMNPHFLFNALNSIQQMILSGDETTATRFLSKFSKLLRTVLTNSDKEEVSVKEEMELLELYVELESLRFKESFNYSIECDEGLDAEEIFVPALLMQPLVENAIWHGLMHKSGQRQLKIEFNECNEGCLVCRIEDNGVGRKASAINGNPQQHTGKGLSVAIERLQVLNEKNGTNNSLNIHDLKDESGEPAGTRIEIIYYH